METIYSRINWENEPSVATPVNEDNLNRMDYALSQLDQRVVTHDAEITELQGYETRAALSVREAAESASSAASSASSASESAAAASGSASAAESSADLSQNWAIGTPAGKRSDEATNNSKYFAQQSSASASNAASSATAASDSATAAYTYIGQVSEAAENAMQQIRDALDANAPIFQVNLLDGHLYWQGGSFNFTVVDGNLWWEVAA